MSARPTSDAATGATAYRTLFVTSLVGFMVALEITVIALARDEIAQAFPDAAAAALSWVITAYNIGVASVLLVGATMRDVPPPRFAMAGAGRTTIFQLCVALAVAAAIGIVGRPASPAEFLGGMRWVWLLSLVESVAGRSTVVESQGPSSPMGTMRTPSRCW